LKKYEKVIFPGRTKSVGGTTGKVHEKEILTEGVEGWRKATSCSQTVYKITKLTRPHPRSPFVD